MLRTMVSQLIQHDRMETTLPKAKELRRLADKAVTWGKEVSGLLMTSRLLYCARCRRQQPLPCLHMF